MSSSTVSANTRTDRHTPTDASLRLDPTLRSLAAREAVRFARHPVFIVGAVLAYGLSIALGAEQTPDSLSSGLVLTGFFLGVFGFVTAHRLTTSTRRAQELVETAPVARERRTLALCLACLVPFFAGLLWIVVMAVLGSLWPPQPVAPGQHAFWFGDQSSFDVLAIMLDAAAISSLGGSLLGVAVATWAPHRWSLLLGPVVLVMGVLMLLDLGYPTYNVWSGLSPFAAAVDDVVVHGDVIATSVSPAARPVGHTGYALGLSGLAAIAALLRDAPRPRFLLVTGAALAIASAASLLLSVR
jgi:hypothetical protein